MYAIVAADRNWAIGRDGDQLCYIPADLKRFQALTTGHAVVLGRRTLSTFPGGRPLKGRRNLILSRDPAFRPEGAEVFRDLESLLAAAPADAFVIGGGQVYRQLLDRCDTVYVTRLDRVFPADAWFPDLDADPAWMPAGSEGPFDHQGVGETWSPVGPSNNSQRGPPQSRAREAGCPLQPLEPDGSSSAGFRVRSVRWERVLHTPYASPGRASQLWRCFSHPSPADWAPFGDICAVGTLSRTECPASQVERLLTATPRQKPVPVRDSAPLCWGRTHRGALG